MKKIFFVFAMLLMSITSALAESETISLALEPGEYVDQGWVFSGTHFNVSGDVVDEDGIYINNYHIFTIEAKDDEIIKRVECTISYGNNGTVKTTEGIVAQNPVGSGDICEIYDINKSSLEISSNITSSNKPFQVSVIKVYYEKKKSKPFVMDEYVQTESFSIGYCNGRNVTITGQGTGSFNIANGKDVKITAKDHVNVKILKVDLELGDDNNNSTIKSTPGVVIGSGKKWTVNNINSSSLTISNSGSGNVKINSIKVYYVELSEDKEPEEFDVSKEYSCSGESVTIKGTKQYNMELANGNNVTITANSGMEISQVDLVLGNTDSRKINSTSGDVEGSGKKWTIKNIDSSTLTLSHPGEGDEGYSVWIETITVHYKERIAPATIELVANKVKDDYGATYYWTTFYSNASNYQAPEGTQVFKVNLSGVDITMTEIVDRIVTKGQGVVLKSTNSNIEMSRTDSVSSDGYSRNSLLGTSVSITNPGNAYVLSYSQSKGVGFYKLSDTGTIGINKAYLVYESSEGSANARTFFSFDDVVTGIEMNKVDGNEGNDKVYDLQGRRIANPSNGIYIVNGKKVIMNKR